MNSRKKKSVEVQQAPPLARRFSHRQNKVETAVAASVETMSISPTAPPRRSNIVPGHNPFDDPPSSKSNGSGHLDSSGMPLPLPRLESDLSETDLKESAYELLVGAVGARLSMRTSRGSGLERGNSASSLFKNAFGFSKEEEKSSPPVGTSQTPATPMEIIQKHMGVSDFSDMRIRKALQRAAAGQAAESMVVPVELLQYLGPSDFPSHHDFQHWKWRQLTLLEEGLLRLPVVRLEGPDPASQRLKQVLAQLQAGQLDIQDSGAKQALRSGVMTKAERPLKGEARGAAIHWADGYPLNIYFYEALIRAIFDPLNPGTFVGEVDEILEVLQRVWGTLGFTRMMHEAVFAWAMFRQYTQMGQKEIALLAATATKVKELSEELKASIREGTGPDTQEQWELLRSLLGTMQAFAEKRLLAYHQAFPTGAQGPMEHLMGIAVVGEEVLQLDQVKGFKAKSRSQADVKKEKAEQYIRSSLMGEFALIMEAASSRRASFKGESAPLLVSLAVDAGELAEDEFSNFTPALKPWCSNAGGVAAATVHSCFKRELKQYVAETKTLSMDSAQVLLAADKLEKQLIQIAVEDGVDADDGGKSSIRDMTPFDTEKSMAALLQEWVTEHVARMGEWVDRCIQMEVWDPSALQEHYAPSLVDVVRLLSQTLEEFFTLPLRPKPELLEQLAGGIDAALQKYVERLLGTTGSKEQFVPPIPPLTRYKKDVLVRFQNSSQSARRNSEKGTSGTHGSTGGSADLRRSTDGDAPKLEAITLPRLCTRINTLNKIVQEAETFAQRIRTGWENAYAPPPPPPVKSAGGVSSFWTSKAVAPAPPPLPPPLPAELLNMFEGARTRCRTGIASLCQVAGYRVAFYDLRGVFLDGLYAGGVARARMSGVITQLSNHLVAVVDNIMEPLRDQLVLALFRALLQAFLRVLLAPGPNRAFLLQDSSLLEDDLAELKDLFIDGGEGLPAADVERAATPVDEILNLFATPSDKLVAEFEAAYREALTAQGEKATLHGKAALLKLPIPKDGWRPRDANTLLRVLCYRSDRKASKYLKKMFDMPKEIWKY